MTQNKITENIQRINELTANIAELNKQVPKPIYLEFDDPQAFELWLCLNFGFEFDATRLTLEDAEDLLEELQETEDKFWHRQIDIWESGNTALDDNGCSPFFVRVADADVEAAA